MKRSIIVLLCSFFVVTNLPCKTLPNFTIDEISEFSLLVKSLSIIDFTFGKKCKKEPTQLNLFKVNEDTSDTGEFYFSISEYPRINKMISAVEKSENEIFIKFAVTPSGWCRGIVYMFVDDEFLRNRAEVFIQLDDYLFYFEGKA